MTRATIDGVARRRFGFATPFVLVIGCGHPREPASEPTPVVLHDASVAIADAAVADAPASEGGLLTAEQVREMCARPGANCNPPRPKPDAGVAPKLVGRVLATRPGDGAHRSIVTIGIGARDGVLATWQGTLFDGALRLGSFTIVEVREGSTIGHSDAAPTAINGRSQVRFPSPDSQ